MADWTREEAESMWRELGIATPDKIIQAGASAIAEWGRSHASKIEDCLQRILGDYDDVRAKHERLMASTKVMVDAAQREIHEWYGARLQALREWAEVMSPEISEAVQSCLAFGRPAPNKGMGDHLAILKAAREALKMSEQELAIANQVISILRAELSQTQGQLSAERQENSEAWKRSYDEDQKMLEESASLIMKCQNMEQVMSDQREVIAAQERSLNDLRIWQERVHAKMIKIQDGCDIMREICVDLQDFAGAAYWRDRVDEHRQGKPITDAGHVEDE